jgi:putative tryptophan/tyrosine transport system substrate-binding protein
MLLSRHTRRREFIAVLGGAALWPFAARAQQASIPLVGLLYASSAAASARFLDAFRGGMLELGYVEEGKSNIRYEYRFADGYLDRLPDLAIDLVRLRPDVIVSAPLPSHIALRQATSTIPIVMATGADPVGFGLVTSLSHPGGNVTGLANFAEVLAAKQIDLLRELIPRLSRLGALVNVTNPLHVPQLRETKAAAVVSGIDLMPQEIRSPDELGAAFEALVQEHVEALAVPPDTVFNNFRSRIAELAAAMRMPAIYGFREAVEDGGLMSYGPDNRDNYRRAAVYVDKILKGAKPGDLPIEQPTKFELVINLKTAKALGLTIPPQLLARADEVIE